MTHPNRVSIDKALDDVSISNGLVWSLDNELLYYIDTPTGQVDVFSFDPLRGAIGKYFFCGVTTLIQSFNF